MSANRGVQSSPSSSSSRGVARVLISAMPRSTFNAVFTPVSDRPSSTSVMATAGRMPTATVSASRMRDTAAMLSSMRPMKLSTISSAEMSISTPLAPWATILAVKSSSSAVASWSCISTWTVTSSASPNFNIGMRSISADPVVVEAFPVVGGGALELGYGPSGPAQRDLKGIRQRRLADDVELDAEMNHGLGDLRTDAADDAIGAHEARRRRRFQKMLRRQGIDRRHAGNVDDGDLGAFGDDRLEQIFHHDLGPLAVERTDDRQGEDAFPQFYDRRREFQNLALLTRDDAFPTLLIHFY